MKLVNCADCKKEISLTSEKCTNCGSEKQFRGLVFLRKELAKEGMTPREMMRFQKCGGEIKIIKSWKKILKIVSIVFALFFAMGIINGFQTVKHTLKDGTVIEVTNFELNDIRMEEERKQKEQELLASIEKLQSFQYEHLATLYEELKNVSDNQEYQKKYAYYEKIDDNKWKCKTQIQERDKSNLLVKDSYKIVAGRDNRLEGWTDKNIFTYVYSFKAKNAFGVEITHTSSNKCTYDADFNLSRIEKLN